MDCNDAILILKACLDEKYHKAIDNVYKNNIVRKDFVRKGENKICFYYKMFLVISFDTLNNYEIDINTNLLQTRLYEYENNKQWNYWASDFKLISKNNFYFLKNYPKIIADIRRQKLNKIKKATC